MHKAVPLLLLTLIFCIGVSLWYVNTPPQNESTEVYFVIQEGEPFTTIARRLQNHNLIRSSLFIRFMARITDQDTVVQSGSYAIPIGMTAYQLINFLTAGRQLLIKVPIPEGLTITKVATILDQLGIASAEEFIALAHDPELIARHSIPADSLEGYLFPDTYYFVYDYSVEAIISQMVAGFRANLRNRFPELAIAEPDALHRVITLASMIEKEYLTSEEAPLISSVFHNRLTKGQRLEACSTIVYLITEVEGREHPSRLYFADLERESPYNTYRNSGLPPTPIANPGSVAIDAAFNPADTNYLYFVLEAEDSIRHQFSETFSEHAEARIIYLRSRD